MRLVLQIWWSGNDIRFFNRYRINDSEASSIIFDAVYKSTFWRECSTTLYFIWKIIGLKFPNFREHAQGWYYREQGFRRGENIRPPTTCNFLYCLSFIPHKWKYSPHAFAQCKRTVIKYAYDRTDVPEKWTNAISSAMLCILRTFARDSL